MKVDVERRTTEGWHDDGCFPGEPVFVRGRTPSGEDEGVLLSVVLDAERSTSFMLVLDAHTLEELGRAEVPHHIPSGSTASSRRATRAPDRLAPSAGQPSLPGRT